MGSQKPLIIPWLTSQIGNPEYPGLTWVNAEQMHFRIPWKHGLRHDRSDQDFRIFQGWAIANGTYRPGIDEPKPSEWKRNLRSALNRKSEVMVMEDHSSDSSDPYKVYAIISQSRPESQEASDDSQIPGGGISPSSDSPWLEQPNGGLSLNRPLEETLGLMNISLQEVDGAENWRACPSPAGCIPGELGPSQASASLIETGYAPETASPYSSDGMVESCPALAPQEAAPQDSNPLEHFFPNNTLETDFEVKVFYRGVQVLATTVQNHRGLCLTSGLARSPRLDLEDIVLPEPSSVRDPEVVRMINKVLQNLGPGLLLEVNGSNICGLRHGKCKGYWTMTEDPAGSEPTEIMKGEPTVLYTTQQFVAELIGFMQRTRKESPLYSIWLCLGEHWPDPSQKPWTKKFIMVQVTPVVFKLLHEISYSTGASSLRSSEMNLQISDSTSYESLLSYLQDLEEKMEL
uniref:Interferon regulatory factor 3B n=1 Tax=Andrias davidianus TaxID=141262 RepID=A0A7G7LHW6_ANDDA|nr:interferon regulatory factor 3B [Andrias davidianus]